MQRIRIIRELNDQLRQYGIGGKVYITSGIQALEEWLGRAIITTVREFDQFDQSNDPYGEHDMGAVDVAGTKAMWKIDYYDPSITYASDDPADPQKTVRVLTIMLADEY
ncbi:DUF3768 domain-containing protein [Paramagnetospirillum magneticum]|uniref:DUF3768 domain-containing protein n=1 Tax=Paramagnetospirillum magneticum (strain ATCC 700264 / AMB-1) TaxID=342108 RepID=Q2W0W6_PARM1|nr:DUF3768 domain-containing protein [Paramagnetospirillum magneticum]BAE52509.1 hypothetical protein amb3705 [Paramagnetospirillum magneticum AMB-1]